MIWHFLIYKWTDTKCCVLKLVNMLKSMYTPFWIHHQRVHLKSGCAYEIWMWFEKGNFQSCFTAWCLQIFIWECPQLNAKSTLVEVMAWCRQATSHHLSPCWPRSLLTYDIIRPQWINNTNLSYSVSSNLLSIFEIACLTDDCTCTVVLNSCTSGEKQEEHQIWTHCSLAIKLVPWSWVRTLILHYAENVIRWWVPLTMAT